MDDNLDDLYHSYWEVHNEKMNQHSPLEIAAILMVQSLTIYRSVLSEEEYDKMVDDISGMRDSVLKLEEKHTWTH